MSSNNPIDVSPAPISEDEQNKLNTQYKNLNWKYFENDDKFLLRLCVFKVNERHIRFEILNTINISDNYKMFAHNFNGKDFIEDLDIKEDYDAYTYLDRLFKDIPPIIKYNNKNKEIELLIITKSGKKPYKFSLKSTECIDKEFFKKNIEKRIKQITNYNEKLIKRNEYLQKEIEEFNKKSEKLSKLNEKCSKDLKDLKKLQDEAITQLNS